MGKEACGIPGRGEEDEYRGWEVQDRVDEAQRGREEEEGSSIGGLDWGGVPGPGGELGWQATAMAGHQTTAGRMPPPSHFGGGGLSSHLLLIITDLQTVMAQMVGIRSGRVIGVISR